MSGINIRLSGASKSSSILNFLTHLLKMGHYEEGLWFINPDPGDHEKMGHYEEGLWFINPDPETMKKWATMRKVFGLLTLIRRP